MEVGLAKIAVVIPSYRVSRQVLGVIGSIPPLVAAIYVVDDACPEMSGALVTRESRDPRVRVIQHPVNQGVGGAMLTGYKEALSEGMDIVVKVDGDGQMDAAAIEHFIRPIIDGRADYTKGNRFYSLDLVRQMPAVRLFGNAVLSIVNKVASGYWSVMDPTNGYTAISAKVLRLLPFGVIERRYFFESDMLYHLGLVRACVIDIPLPAVYGNETSSLSVGDAALRFPGKYLIRALKRFVYNYVLRDFNAGTIEALLGFGLLTFGTLFGSYKWTLSVVSEAAATSGTVMLAALPVILGVQLLLSALYYDIQNQPRDALHKLL